MSRGNADAALGMMDAAYFIGRKELLDYFNDLLDLNLTKIEQTASGAIACQVTDLIFPGSVPMSRVNWAARSDYEFVQNYKLLQSAFTKHRVQRHVDVDKLIRAKYQDNLEFCQWLKAFAEGQHPDEAYDAAAVRARGKGGAKYNAEMGRRSSSSSNNRGASTSVTRTRPATARTNAGATSTKPTLTTTKNAAISSLVSSSNGPLRERVSNPVVIRKSDPLGDAVAADAALMLKNKDLSIKVEDLELAVLETEKERNFYFEKLRHVEIILQVYQEKGNMDADETEQVVERVFKILYATAEDRLTVNDDGEVVVAAEDEELLVDDDDGIFNDESSEGAI